MNIMWLVVLATFLLLTAGVGTLMVKTVRFRTRQLMVRPIESIELPEAAIVNRLGKAIRIQTVSFDDPASINYETFHDFHRFISEEYPGLSQALTKTVINTYSLLYEWTGTEPNLKPIILTAHMDVVPVERDRWEVDPFSGRVENFQVIEKTIRETSPDTIVAPALAPGRSDAEYYYGLADDVYLFAPYVYSPELLESVHGHNERITVENYLQWFGSTYA